MKSSTKRILMSVLTLVLTVVALGTTTFAWFSLSNIGTVTGISADVQAGDGLEVRMHHTDGTNSYDSTFKNHLSEDDWAEFMDYVKAANDDKDFKFGAVSTADGIEFNELVQRVDGQYGIAAVTDGANIKYLEFNLEFRSLQAGTVALTSIVLGGEAFDWSPAGGSDYNQLGLDPATETNHVITSAAANAARVAFVNGGTVTSFEAPGLAYDVTGNKITEGNTAGQTTGVVHGQWAYLDTRGVKIYTTDVSDVEVVPTATEILGATAASTVTDQAPHALGTITLADNNAGHFVASVIVRIWIEGWDADAYDAIFNRNLTVSFTFQKTTTP